MIKTLVFFSNKWTFFLIHPKQFVLIPLLIGKIMVGLVLGAIVGFIRLKTEKVYGSFLFRWF